MAELVEADLGKLAPGTTYPSGRIGVNLPADIPGYVRAFRVMGDVNGTRGLVGWVVELDAFTFGVKVRVRFGRDGTFKVMLEDEEGKEIVGEYVKEQEG